MDRKRLMLIAVAAVLLVSLAGCYTVLRHPTGNDLTSGGDYTHMDVGYSPQGYRTCADCHSDADYYHPYYRYGSSHYRWNDYYGSPWWYDNDSWWYDDGYYDGYHDDPGEQGPEPETGVRHLWGAGGWPTKGWGFGSSSAPENGTRTPAAPVPQPSQPSTGNKVETPTKKTNTDDDDDDSGNDDGGLWKERKKGF